MKRKTFFAALRARNSGLFGTSLSTPQVQGIEALLDAGRALPLHHMANVLAQVYHETGGGMYPIKETVMPWHKNKKPSDATVIGRLDRAYAKGQLTWVKSAYWRGGAFGRGQLQITHDYNYDKFGITNYAEALRLDVSARIAVEGMRDGMFTGKKLADFNFPQDLDNPPRTNPRRIVNGADGSDDKVRTHHMVFAAALEAAGWQQEPAATPVPRGFWDYIFAAFARFFTPKGN
jgi:predicted chitinase